MKKQRKRRNNISYKDVQISYLVDGIDAVATMYKNGQVSRVALRRAFNSLKENGRETSALKEWIQKNIAPGVRGRKAATPGQERIYRVQKIKDLGPFLRLPLDALQVNKGDVLSVLFQKDQVVVRKI